MKKRNWGYLLLIFIFATLLYPVSFLKVKTEKNSQVLLIQRVSPGDLFEFRYVHSVDKTPVSGFFLITPDRMIKPVETHFLSYGPGLPSREGKVYREGGKIIARSDAEEMECFSFFISPLTYQSLIIKNKRIDFSSLKEGEVVTVTVKRYPWGERVLRYGRK